MKEGGGERERAGGREGREERRETESKERGGKERERKGLRERQRSPESNSCVYENFKRLREIIYTH